jgi:hypothetical protein
MNPHMVGFVINLIEILLDVMIGLTLLRDRDSGGSNCRSDEAGSEHR